MCFILGLIRSFGLTMLLQLYSLLELLSFIGDVFPLAASIYN